MLPRPLIDHRTYVIKPRRMAEFIDLFDRLAMPILLETLGHPLGFHVTEVGPLHQFVHLWAYENLADYERRARARDAHSGFAGYLAASEHLIVSQQTMLMRAVHLSSLPGLTHARALAADGSFKETMK